VTRNSLTQQPTPKPASVPKVKEPKEKYGKSVAYTAAEIKFMFNKIENLIGIFDDEDEIDELLA
jgi:hypothetical protein